MSDEASKKHGGHGMSEEQDGEDSPNTAMILKTSTMPIGGLRGSSTNDGVKKTLIQRNDHRPCVTHM